MAKRKQLIGSLLPFVKREVKYLKVYYYKGGKWYRLKEKSSDTQRSS